MNRHKVFGNKTVPLSSSEHNPAGIPLRFLFFPPRCQTAVPFVGHQKSKVHPSHLTEGKEANRRFGYHSNRRVVQSGRSAAISFPFSGSQCLKGRGRGSDVSLYTPLPLFISGLSS